MKLIFYLEIWLAVLGSLYAVTYLGIRGSKGLYRRISEDADTSPQMRLWFSKMASNDEFPPAKMAASILAKVALPLSVAAVWGLALATRFHPVVTVLLGIYLLPILYLSAVGVYVRTKLKGVAYVKIKSMFTLIDARWEQASEVGDETGPFAKAAMWVLAAMDHTLTVPIVAIKEIWYTSNLGLHTKFPNPLILWMAILTAIAWLLEEKGATEIALLLTVFLCGATLYRTLSPFQTRRGILAFERHRGEKISPGRTLSYALLLAANCAVIHLHISRSDISAYSQPLDALDAFYFSITTLATVGYGDIHPQSAKAKIACCFEIVAGLMMLVLAVNASISLWLQKNQAAKALTSTASETAKGLSVEEGGGPEVPEQAVSPLDAQIGAGNGAVDNVPS